MIVVDIDGVVANTDKWMIKEIEERSGKKLIIRDPRVFKLEIDIPDEDVLRYIDDALVKYVDDIVPHNFFRTSVALEKIQHEEGVVHFVTSRSNGDVHKSTRYWLDKNFYELNYELHSLGDTGDKLVWLLTHGADAIVEDRLRTVNMIASRYITPYLVSRPWNTGRDCHEYVKRVNDILDAVGDYFGLLKN